jgi:peroxiredoxin family protein
MIKTLYLSYDGMTDPLGQSQVLPYLKQISSNKEIHIISCEKPTNFRIHKSRIEKIINGTNIHWHPLQYNKFPPIFSTLWDLWRIKKLALKLNKDFKFKLIHCRSHLMALLGLSLKLSINTPFLFDMRSFFPEERVDGNLWPQNNPIYRLIFEYFKKKEVEMFNSASHIVVLTEASKEILKSEYHLEKISVIPCCADFDLFNYKNVSAQDIIKAKDELSIDENQFVLTYLGSLGTWYELDKMLELFKQIKIARPNSIFAFFTPTHSDTIFSKLEEHDLSRSDVRISFIQRSELPKYLSASSISIFFIKNTYSKKASSPTKHAELMGLGIPVIANYGIGDIDSIIENTRTGKLINMNDPESITKVIKSLSDLATIDKAMIRSKGKEIYSLSKGCQTYEQIYSSILKN